MKRSNLISRIIIVCVSVGLIAMGLLISMVISYKSNSRELAKKRFESMVYSLPDNLKAYMNDYDYEYDYRDRDSIKEIGCTAYAFSIYDIVDMWEVKLFAEKGELQNEKGFQISFVNKDGKELYNFGDKDMATLYAKFADDENALRCNLKAYFTKEQYEEIIVKYLDGEELEDYRIEKVVGYYENDTFVPAGIVFYKYNKKTESVKEYTLINESVKYKESLETVTIYDSKYVKKHMKYNPGANDKIANLDIYDRIYDDDYYDYVYNFENDYNSEDLKKTAEDYYVNKVTLMDALGDTDIITEYADDKLISYGVLNLNKENPSYEDAVAVKYSVCYGLDYLDEYVPSIGEILTQLSLPIIVFLLILCFGIFVIVEQEARLTKTKIARNTLISAMAREMKIPAEVLKTCADRIHALQIFNNAEEIEGENADAFSRESANLERYDENIYAEANYISELVNQLLMCTRNGGAGYSYEKVNISVNDIVKNVCGRYEILAEKKNVTIKVKERLESFIISADKKMMEIAVSGVVSKAVSLCDEGGKVVVEISPRSIGVSYEGKILDYFERKAIWNMTKNKHILDKNSPETGSLGLYAKLIKINGLEYYTYAGENGMEFNISKPLK